MLFLFSAGCSYVNAAFKWSRASTCSEDCFKQFSTLSSGWREWVWITLIWLPHQHSSLTVVCLKHMCQTQGLWVTSSPLLILMWPINQCSFLKTAGCRFINIPNSKLNKHLLSVFVLDWTESWLCNFFIFIFYMHANLKSIICLLF